MDRDVADDNLDETIEETFPASDAPGNTPETGILIDPAPETQPAPPKEEEPLRNPPSAAT